MPYYGWVKRKGGNHSWTRAHKTAASARTAATRLKGSSKTARIRVVHLK